MKKTSAQFQYLQTVINNNLAFVAIFISWLIPVSMSFASDYSQVHYSSAPTKQSESDVPGTLVNIGTHRLHIHCQGNGNHTVVVDTGLGATSIEWNHIQSSIAKRTRICLYDRAGYGYSDPGPLPRTSSYIVDELYKLLTHADVKGPYILVGHSFGGYNMQLFAGRYPHLTAGVILVDSSHMDQYSRFLAPPINVKTSPPNKSRLGFISFSTPQLHPNLPDEVRNDVLKIMLTQSMRYAMAYEFYNFRQSADEVKDTNLFPNTPLLVLTRGERVYPQNQKGDLMEVLWMQLQSELSERSVYSAHVIADKSGHFIHLDQPQLVIDSIAFLVDFAKDRVDANNHEEHALESKPDRYAFHDATWRTDRLNRINISGPAYVSQTSEAHLQSTLALVSYEFNK